MAIKMEAPAAAIYCRISNDPTGKAAGVTRQERECRELAKANGWPVVEVFTDDDISAYTGVLRPRYGEMLQAISQGRVNLVVAWHPDRLYRRLADLEELIDSGAQIATVTAGDLDLSTPSGRMTARILGSVARHESEHKAERIRSAHADFARSGRAPWGVGVPFGYRSEGGTLRAHPTQAKEVRRMFERFASGWGLRAIARDLNQRGVVGQRGSKRWNTTRVGRILDNPTYAAYRHYNGERTKGQWKPLVSEERLERVQDIRTATKAPRPALNRQGLGRNVLSGLLFCSCGAPMWRSSTSDPRRSTYECSRAAKKRAGDCRAGGVAALRVEEMVAAQFLSKISEPYARHVRKAPKRAMSATESHAAHRSDVDAHLADVERKIEALVEARLESPGPAFQATYRKKAEALEAERERLVIEKAKDRVAGEMAQQRAADLDALRRRAADLAAIWELASSDERNEMLRVAIERVKVLTDRPRLKTVAVTWADWVS